MRSMVEKSRELQDEAQEYLGKINGVLCDGFDSFSDAVKRNMERSSSEFHMKLSEAVNMISSQIQELDAALDNLVRTVGSKLQ